MDWESLRGSSIKNDKERHNHKYLEKKIIYEVNKKLDKFKSNYKVSSNNKYGKWVIK